MRLIVRAVTALAAALTLATGLASALGAGREATMIGYAQRAPDRFDLFFHDLTFNLRVNLTRTPDFDEPDWDWSPQLGRVAFTRAAPGQTQICMLDLGQSALGGEAVHCLEPLSAADDLPRWSPVGSPNGSPVGLTDAPHLAFRSAGGALHILSHSDLTAVPATVPLPDLNVSDYAWSPEGDRIVAVAAKRSTGEGRLILLERDTWGTGLRRRPLDPRIENLRAADAPVWSPRGDGLLFPVTAGVGHNILLADLADGQVEPLTTSGDNVNAIWMPDGEGVLFLSWSRSGTTWTLLDRLTGRRGAFLFHRLVLDSRPAWSSDGQVLAFASYAGQRFSIWTIDMADGQPRVAVISRQELGAPRFVSWHTPPVDEG